MLVVVAVDDTAEERSIVVYFGPQEHGGDFGQFAQILLVVAVLDIAVDRVLVLACGKLSPRY